MDLASVTEVCMYVWHACLGVDETSDVVPILAR